MLRLSDHLQSTHQVGTDTESGTTAGIHSHRRNEHIQDAESGSSSEGDVGQRARGLAGRSDLKHQHRHSR